MLSNVCKYEIDGVYYYAVPFGIDHVKIKSFRTSEEREEYIKEQEEVTIYEDEENY